MRRLSPRAERHPNQSKSTRGLGALLTIKSAGFRLVLPLVYFIVSGVLLVGCLLNMAHSIWCQYFLNSMFPIQLLTRVVLPDLLSRGIVAQASPVWLFLDNVLTVPIPFIVTLVQYYLIGLLLDRAFHRGR